MVEILWHRRESRRQTEKTNFDLQSWEAPAYSKINPREEQNGRVPQPMVSNSEGFFNLDS